MIINVHAVARSPARSSSKRSCTQLHAFWNHLGLCRSQAPWEPQQQKSKSVTASSLQYMLVVMVFRQVSVTLGGWHETTRTNGQGT